MKQLGKDELYIDKVLNGDVKSFRILVERYQDLVYHIAFKILRNQMDAEEVAQDTFMKAFNSLETFSRESKFSSWLYKIAYYTAISKTRSKHKKMQAHMLPVEDNILEGPEIQQLDLDSFRQEEQKKYINMAMGKLPEQIQIVLTLFYLEECSLKEIHEITEITISNLKTLLHRGRKKLYFELERILQQEIKSIV